MKATLEFDDITELRLALNGGDYFSALWDIKQEIRNHNKYDKPLKEVLDRIEEILYGINLDEIE